MALVQDWVEMWNSYDLNAVASLFLDDDRLTYFSSEREGVIRGFESVMEHHRGFGFRPGGADGGSRLWVEELRADLFGETSVITGIWYFQRAEALPDDGSLPVGGSETRSPPQKGPVTFVCVHEDGAWRFVHMSFGEYPAEGSDPQPESGGG
jgi:hypothetical protein